MSVKRRIAATELMVQPIEASFSLKDRIYGSLKKAITPTSTISSLQSPNLDSLLLYS